MANMQRVNAVNITDTNSVYTSPVDINLAAVNNILRLNEHPHPLAIVAVVLASLILIYYIYVVLAKPSLTGIWMNGDRRVKVEHNKWSDDILVDGYIHGRVNGGAIYLANGGRAMIGVLHKHTIYWVGSYETWRRPLVVA